MSVRPGTRLDGRYRLADRLAYGGMGEVWRATDEVLSREVAVKILRPELAEDEAFVRRFRAEARTTSGLPHNGIAAVYDYGETRVGEDGQSPAPYDDEDADPVAYLVMELVPGEALSSILSRDGALGSERTLDLVAQAARALHAAHLRGVIHRDIKPANLMVTPDGRVKVTDFGIARPLDHEPLTATGQVMGTAHYLAPELAKGQDASPLSDVYALGVVAYECLAGHRPFEGDNQVAVALSHLNEQPPPLPATISAQVRAVVGSAMEKDPLRRMPSAEAFAAALETLRYRQTTDDHLTPGTGIIPGSAAHAGLAAAGLFGTTADRGWTPGGRDAAVGTAPPPVPSTLPPPPGGTRVLGPATAGQARAAMPSAGPGTAGVTRSRGGSAAAGADQAGYGGGGYGGRDDGYGQGGQSRRDGGYGSAAAGGYDGYGRPTNQGGYPGPQDPFRTPTAPGGLPLGPSRRERPGRSIGGSMIVIGALVAVLAVILLVAFLNGALDGSPAADVGTETSAPALTSSAPVKPVLSPTVQRSVAPTTRHFTRRTPKSAAPATGVPTQGSLTGSATSSTRSSTSTSSQGTTSSTSATTTSQSTVPVDSGSPTGPPTQPAQAGGIPGAGG